MDLKLNPKQAEAVTYNKGPLLIIAGAGTGKTTVITERIKWLITKKHALASEILALTFTEKASQEMEDRVDKALPYGVTQMWITTFHSFGEKILRSEALSIGLDPGYKLMTEAETVIFFRKNLFQFELNYYRPLGNPNKFIEAMLTHFNRLKDEDIAPSEYLLFAKKEKGEESKKYLELAYAFRKYEELKVKESVMDFADLITNTLKIFRRRKNLLMNYQKQFKYILIDEFQDTNFAQNELAKILARKSMNITAVGDDDQAIYRFRGAAVSNIIQFRKAFPKVKIVVLKENYRSTVKILDSAYKLIQHNNPDRLEVKEKIDKKLTSQRKVSGEEPQFIYRQRIEDEAEEVVATIMKIKEKKIDGKEKYSWSDFAILLRANNHAEPFIRALSRKGIPYQFLGPGMLFRQKEVKDLIAYIKFLVNNDDSVALFRVLAMPIFDIPVKDLSLLLNFTRRLGLSLYEALDIVNNPGNSNYRTYLPFFIEEAKIKFAKIGKMIESHLTLSKNDTAGQILYAFLEDSGLLQSLTEYKTLIQEKAAVNISKFFDKLKTFEVDHEDASIYAVADWIDMSMELGESPTAANSDWMNNDAVNLLTVHSSKGLEFGNVFLTNLVIDRFPTRERKEKIPIPDALIKEILPVGDYHLEEERRLFYVGLTRAKDNLILSASAYYGEGKRERKISPFAIETLGEGIMTKTPGIKESQLSLLEWKKEDMPEATNERIPVEYLSFSQIDTFLTCPLQYKYRYVIKIPLPSSAAASFGSSMHKALQTFYERFKRQEQMTKEILLSLLDEVWIPLGYGNKKYEEKMKLRGRVMLSSYFDKAYDPKAKVESLEKLFRIKLSPTLKLGGKIDRVDRINNDKIEIIDYKTGRRPSEKEIKTNLQMTVYALAARDRGIYDKKPQDVILSFYFFDAREKISSSRTTEQLDATREKLLNIAEEISISKFEPKVGPWCDFCDFRLICEAWQ